jgi:cytoskeletal protein CcmA (bactofilin family)
MKSVTLKDKGQGDNEAGIVENFDDSLKAQSDSRELDDSANGPVSIIGESLKFKGALSAGEDLIIDGVVEGSIDQGKCCLTIREKGRVKADVNATKIFVEGNVDGDLRSTVSVTIRESGVVSGSVIAPKVALDEGSTFNGSIEMRDPKAG